MGQVFLLRACRAFNRRYCALSSRAASQARQNAILSCVPGIVELRLQSAAVVLRFRTMGHTLTIRLTTELARWLEETARRSGRSQGEIVRTQLERARSEKKAR